MVQLKHMQDVNLHVQSQSSALGSPPTTRRRRNRCASFLPSMPLTVFLCCNRCCWMHLLAANVCRNELNVKVRNSILSVEHQEWRSHQVLVGVTRECNLYLYVTGGEEESVHFHLVASSYASLSAMLTLPPQIGFGSAERIRRRRAVWASDGGVQEWNRWRAVTAAEDETGWICYFQHHDRPSARLSTELETMWRYCLLRRETREENTSLIIPVTSWF